MNELSLTVQSLMARGTYKGVMLAAAYHKDLHPDSEDPMVVEGAGTLPMGKLAVMILAGYLRNIPADQRDVMATYIAKRAKELAKNAPTQEV